MSHDQSNWRELAEKATKEQDPEKLMAIVRHPQPVERAGHTSPRPRLSVSPPPGMGNADDVKNDEQRYREGRNQAQGTRLLPGTE